MPPAPLRRLVGAGKNTIAATRGAGEGCKKSGRAEAPPHYNVPHARGSGAPHLAVDKGVELRGGLARMALAP